jgi:hypothetical protein
MPRILIRNSTGHESIILNLGRRIPSSGMLHRVALVRTNNSEEIIASIIGVTIIGELGTLSATST